jgi:hypothetical protein
LHGQQVPGEGGPDFPDDRQQGGIENGVFGLQGGVGQVD